MTNRRQRRANSRDTVRVERIDRSTPGPIRVRCRIPFAFDATMGLVRTGSTPVSDSPATSAAAPVDVSGSAAIEGRAESAGGEQITGAASSTSIDWYGTRMGLSALESMARQFAAGVDYFPRHHSWTASVEWYEVIGRTSGAEIKRETVKAPAEGTGTGDARVLYVTTDLDLEEELAKKLVRKIDRGEQIGQSIGGWFTEIAVKYDEEGWVTDIEVLDVELDHLAAVRSPANPDCTMIWVATQRALVEAGGETRARLAMRGQADQRSIQVEPDESGAVVVRFLRSLEQNDDDENDVEDPAPAARSTTDAAPVVDPTPAAAANSTDLGGSPPSSEVVPEARGQEQVMTEEQIQALVARSVAAALTANKEQEKAEAQARETARLAEVGRAAEAARAQGTPTGTPPAAGSAGGESAEIVLLRARTEAAEAEARAAQARARASELLAAAGNGNGVGTRAADRSTPAAGTDPTAPAPAKNPAARDIPRPVPGPNGCDMREIAPNAIRAVGRSFGQLSLDARTVLECDGMKAIAQLAQVEGTAPRLSELCLANEALLSDKRGAAKALAGSFGPLAIERAKANRNAEPGWDDRGGLEDLLHSVIRAGADDGLIKSKEVEASWA